MICRETFQFYLNSVSVIRSCSNYGDSVSCIHSVFNRNNAVSYSNCDVWDKPYLLCIKEVKKPHGDETAFGIVNRYRK